MVAGCLFLALQLSPAQNAGRKPSADSVAATRNLLIEKAQALEARGRPDMAIQLWQQILLSDTNNVESLAGMARDLRLNGSDKAIDALDRLRKVSPNNPDIPKIEGLASTRAESAELRQAGDLAKQGKPEEAMNLYKQLYGDRPPDGDIALAYYQTLYGTAKGKPAAITAMRALAEHNPGDPRFAVELGVMLTYEQKTRGEGIRILKEHPKDLNAQAALRQALLWDSPNPASAAELRDYLKEHPQDTELAGRLKEDETSLAQMNSGIARTPAERLAFNANQFDGSGPKFRETPELRPRSPEALNGLAGIRKARRAVTAAGLQRPLDPEYEIFPKTTRLPPSPAYGPDPDNGSAPVVLTPAQPQTHTTPARRTPGKTLPQQDAPKIFPPSASRGQTPSAPVYVPRF